MTKSSGASWKDVLKDQVAAGAAETKKRSRGDASTIRLSRIHFSVEVHPYLVRAARQRGISISGYIRRATLAHVALDLGLDPIELFKIDSAIRPLSGVRAHHYDLDGKAYGRWEVKHDDPRDDR